METFARVRDRFTPLTLVTIAAICGGWFLLERLTSEVLEKETQSFDEAVLVGLRLPSDLSVPVGPAWVLHAVRDINSLGGVTVLAIITILATAFLLISRRKATALYLLVSVFGGWAISNVLKLAIARPRPTIVPHLMDVCDLSYPSGHAMMAAVTYLTIAAILSRANEDRATRMLLLSTAVILIILIGLCRIYLGVHYPTDVIAGWCAGSTWALCCFVGTQKLFS